MKAFVARWSALGLLLAGGWQLTSWSWIEAKAWLACGLIDRAWETTRATGRAVRPWPWADTWPVARLTVPALGVERTVLHGASARTLAFGPAWDSGSAPPGGRGVTLLTGHRDTHFRFLRELHQGDVIELRGAAGTVRYRVDTLTVIDSRTTRPVDRGRDDRLLLITCYPFDPLAPGGPYRYLVGALRTATERPAGGS